MFWENREVIKQKKYIVVLRCFEIMFITEIEIFALFLNINNI